MSDSHQDALRAALAPLIAERGVRSVAQAAGWQHSHLSAWMHARRAIPPRRLDDICRELGVELRVRAVCRRRRLSRPG